jgi:RNA polymerase sigma-70 factor (ECF subfamily)
MDRPAETEHSTSEEAFNRYVLPELPVLYRTARSLTRSDADAEDLVQDTLLRAFRAIDRFDGRYPRAWLLTILRNTNINRARKKKPDLLDDPVATFERSTDFAEHTGPEQIVLRPVFETVVLDAFDQLPEKFLSVIRMVDLEGKSYGETADALEIPVGTVMSRLHRARKRIRDEISSQGLDSAEAVLAGGGDVLYGGDPSNVDDDRGIQQ